MNNEMLKHFEEVKALNEARILNCFHRAKDSYGTDMDKELRKGGPLHLDRFRGGSYMYRNDLIL